MRRCVWVGGAGDGNRKCTVRARRSWGPDTRARSALCSPPRLPTSLRLEYR